MDVTKTLVFMTCLCLARDLVTCDDFEEAGKDITLTPSIRGKPTEILWKHNENKVLEYDGSEVAQYGSFRGRVVVDFETGQLTIRKLNSQDSGQYQSDIVINGKVQTSSHSVTVLDPLSEPQVTCEPDESSNVKKLLCSVESGTQPSYQWSGSDINIQLGPELLVEEQEENRDSVYTCTVKTNANSKSADFALKDCPTVGKAGSTVLVSVLIATVILIVLILLAVFLYRRKTRTQEKLSEPNKMDPEDGEDQNLLKKDAIPGSSDATLPSHSRLPAQKDSIAYKNWNPDNGSDNSGEGQKPLKETKKLLEHNLKQSLQSMSETNQEDKEQGNEGELDQNEKNSESAVKAEENTYSKPDERQKQSQEDEEKLTQESGNGEKSPEHQMERLEEQKTHDNEDNQTPGETEEAMDRRDTGKENTYSKLDETEKERPKQSQEEEEKENSQILTQESENGEKSPGHQMERLEEQKTDHNEDNQTPGETEEVIDRRDTETETASPQSAVTVRNNMDTGNEEVQLHENEKESQSDDGEQSQKTEDAANGEDDVKPGEKNERSEEESHEGMDRANTADTGPAVNHTSDGGAPSAPAGSPANLDKEPINSSVSSANQTDPSNCTDQDEEEEERKPPGPEQEDKDGQGPMSEEKEKAEEKSSTDFDKQTDPDSAKDSVSQRDEAVKSDKDPGFIPIDDSGKVVQTRQEDGGDGGQRDMSSEPEQDMKQTDDPPEMSQK